MWHLAANALSYLIGGYLIGVLIMLVALVVAGWILVQFVRMAGEGVTNLVIALLPTGCSDSSRRP
jgi:hypothetical protein